jgi:hypothetical protein
MGHGGGKIKGKGRRGSGHGTKTIAQVGLGEKRWDGGREGKIEGEIESNAETQRALRIRREEKGLTQRAQRLEHRDHGEF